jgi:hypothetical protein
MEIDHPFKPRECLNRKPTLMILKGESMVGKTNLGFLLKNTPNSYYVSLDQLTLDENLPINRIKNFRNKLGYDFASKSINQFYDIVFKYKLVFIDYCFDFISNKQFDLYLFDSTYFNNEEFLNDFIKKFEDKYYIWVTTRP